MGLDKWLKPEEAIKKGKEERKTKDQTKTNRNEPIIDSEKPSPKLIKYTLICPNAKCKYQKRIVKKRLTEIDKICPRCKKEMKIKEN